MIHPGLQRRNPVHHATAPAGDPDVPVPKRVLVRGIPEDASLAIALDLRGRLVVVIGSVGVAVNREQVDELDSRLDLVSHG